MDPPEQGAFNGILRRIRTRSGRLTFVPGVDDTQNAPAQRHLWASQYGQPIARQRIADVGCWTGELLRLLEPLKAAQLVGVDVDGPWLDTARRLSPSIEFVAAPSLTQLPHQLRSRFDRVFFLETLEHLQRGSEASVLSSVCSLLAPGGQLIMSIPAAGLSALADPAWYLVGHRHYRRGTLTRLLKDAGLELNDCEYSGNIWTSVDTLLLYGSKHLLRRRHTTPSSLKFRTDTGLYPTQRVGRIRHASGCEQARHRALSEGPIGVINQRAPRVERHLAGHVGLHASAQGQRLSRRL